jgi:hypothetical protein
MMTKKWEISEINTIMNTAFPEWKAFDNPRRFPDPSKRQKGWGVSAPANQADDFYPEF